MAHFVIKHYGEVIKTVERENKLRNMNGKENQAWMRKAENLNLRRENDERTNHKSRTVGKR
ncbi:hypothetical protein EA71_01798 [Enterococcus durans]|uniref:Uncharacterized protein n=1 Tax=Enterococcus durans TaxID=53345 RepID=A0A367CHE0_9ENTE|nr:hypothetical protein [Enterococcus durans]MBE8847901.1 hypothetical protein [Enterococcus durans]RCA11043.1 hypothetical protein EA71_01798 [Enterococcus durans]